MSFFFFVDSPLHVIFTLQLHVLSFFFFNDPATPEISPLPLPDPLPILRPGPPPAGRRLSARIRRRAPGRATRTTGGAARVSALRLLQDVPARDDLELIVAVLRPGLLVVARVERPLFAVGHRLEATAVDAVAHEVLLGGRRAPVAEGEVVLVRAALVAVPGDADPEVRVRLEDGHLLIEDRDVFRPDVRLVEVEMGHRTEQRLHGLGGPAHGGERVRRALPGNAIRLFPLARELLLPRPLDRVLPRPLRRRGIRVGLRGRRFRLGAAATRGDRRRGKAAEHEQFEPFHRYALSRFKGWKRWSPSAEETRPAAARRST